MNTQVGFDHYWVIKVSKRRLRRIHKTKCKMCRFVEMYQKIRNTTTTVLFYFHTRKHVEKYLREDQLKSEHQLNRKYDSLAKSTVDISIQTGWVDCEKQLLLREDVAVIIKGIKITGDRSRPMRCANSTEKAYNFLTE